MIWLLTYLIFIFVTLAIFAECAVDNDIKKSPPWWVITIYCVFWPVCYLTAAAQDITQILKAWDK